MKDSSSNRNQLNLVFLGAPGAGKGTQAAAFSSELGLVHIASGDLFREAVRKGSKLGLLAKSYMDKGQLVPDDITIKMILERIATLGSGRGFILDGFPRTLEQAIALDKTLAENGRKIDRAVYFKVSDEELLKRLSGRWVCRNCQALYHVVNELSRVAGRCDKCGGELYQRPDDTMETAKKRLEVYYRQTAPVIDYYRRAGNLLEIDGEQDTKKVTRGLLAVLGQILAGSR